MIRFLRHKEIDFVKWDACIDSSINALPYAYTWYLNIAAENKWDALVLDNYKAVFPLPFKIRILFKQIYQPFFVQQLGLFYADEKQNLILDEFMHAVPKNYFKIYLHLNAKNIYLNNHFKIQYRNTHIISLAKGYDYVFANYHSIVKKNIKAAKNKSLVFTQDVGVEEVINYMQKYVGDKAQDLKQKDYVRLQKLISACVQKEKGIIAGAQDAEKNLLAVTFIINSNNHLIYLLAASSPEGKKKNAMTFLIDSVLRQYAGQNIIFDFEGSMLEGIANFYKNFGAVEIKFPVISG